MIAGVLLEAGVSLASCCGCVFVLLDDGVEDIKRFLRCIYKVQALFLFLAKIIMRLPCELLHTFDNRFHSHPIGIF